MASIRSIQRGMIRATRRPDAEAGISLAKKRIWHANSVAYGFLGQEDVLKRRVTDVGVETVTDWMIASIEAYEQERRAMMDWLIQQTTDAKFRYKLATSATLQPLDEWGNPLPRQPFATYEVGLPIQGGGDAWGTNRKSRAKMTVEDANDFALAVMGADIDWMIRHILAALFTNTAWTYDDPDDDIGQLTVQPLANNDSVVYLKRNGSSAADNHYLAQANAIDDGADNPFPIARRELVEHPTNTGDVVSFIASNLRADTEALADFLPANDPNVRRSLTEDEFVGDEVVAFGSEFLGYVGKVKVVEYDRMPDSYMLTVSAGAPPIIGMREEPEEELQGLFPEFHSVDGNRELNKFIRYAGFGVLNRVGAVVTRIGNASYAIPSGYSAPLKV